MKVTVTIRATIPSFAVAVYRAFVASYDGDKLRALVQERTPAGITIDSVSVQEEKPS